MIVKVSQLIMSISAHRRSTTPAINNSSTSSDLQASQRTRLNQILRPARRRPSSIGPISVGPEAAKSLVSKLTQMIKQQSLKGEGASGQAERLANRYSWGRLVRAFKSPRAAKAPSSMAEQVGASSGGASADGAQTRPSSDAEAKSKGKQKEKEKQKTKGKREQQEHRHEQGAKREQAREQTGCGQTPRPSLVSTNAQKVHSQCSASFPTGNSQNPDETTSSSGFASYCSTGRANCSDSLTTHSCASSTCLTDPSSFANLPWSLSDLPGSISASTSIAFVTRPGPSPSLSLSQPQVTVTQEDTQHRQSPPEAPDKTMTSALLLTGASPIHSEPSQPASGQSQSAQSSRRAPAGSLLSRARNSTINLASLANVTRGFHCSASVGNLWPPAASAAPSQAAAPTQDQASQGFSLDQQAGSSPNRKSSTKEKRRRQKEAERVEKLKMLVSYLRSGSSQQLINPIRLEADELELAQRYKQSQIMCEECLQTAEQRQQQVASGSRTPDSTPICCSSTSCCNSIINQANSSQISCQPSAKLFYIEDHEQSDSSDPKSSDTSDTTANSQQLDNSRTHCDPGGQGLRSSPQTLATWIDNEVNSLVNDLEAKSLLIEKKVAKSSKRSKRRWLSSGDNSVV